jgi:thymidylate synthase
MTISAVGRYVEAANLSEGWLGATSVLYATLGMTTVHLLVRIADPTTEVPEIREAAEALIDRENEGREELDEMPAVETTRNTIFPAAWARRMPEPEDLAGHYRARYTKEGLRGVVQNRRGTYFGRVVAYPRAEGEEPADQLTETVRKLRQEIASNGGAKSSRYEINIYSERCDRNPTSFPCLAHVSVHLHDGELHMQAIYRSEYLCARGYGNFLGLAELQTYIAAAAGLPVGELLLTIGRAKLDSKKRLTGAVLSPLWKEYVENSS